MTRRTKIFALLAALVVVSVVIAVARRPRGAEVTLKFVRFHTNGVATFQWENRLSRRLTYINTTIQTLDFRGAWVDRLSPGRGQMAPPLPRPIVVQAGSVGTIEYRAPPFLPWRIRLFYVEDEGFAGKLRNLAVKAGLLKAKPFMAAVVVSAPITTTPPVPVRPGILSSP